jgi:hypothetical protein
MKRQGFVTNSSSTSFIFFLPKDKEIDKQFLLDMEFPILYEVDSDRQLSLERVVATIQGMATPLDKQEFNNAYLDLKQWLKEELDDVDGSAGSLISAIDCLYPYLQVMQMIEGGYNFKFMEFEGGNGIGGKVGYAMDAQGIGDYFDCIKMGGMIAISNH